MKQQLRWLVPALAVVAVLVFGLLMRQTGETVETGAWGLSFQTEGEAPVGNADSQTLAAYDAIYVGPEGEKVLYLTFDAGYENGCTEAILEALEKHNAPAAFFLVGNYLEQNPDLVRRMVAQGHTVANHTYHHYDMSELTDPAAFARELTSLEDRYLEITGQPMARYYRPPQGLYSQENLAMAQALGYRTVFWSLAYVDWLTEDQPTAQEAFSKLLPRVHEGAVVLLHSTSQTNGEILDELLTRWEAMGYRFGTLDELFEKTFDSLKSK